MEEKKPESVSQWMQTIGGDVVQVGRRLSAPTCRRIRSSESVQRHCGSCLAFVQSGVRIKREKPRLAEWSEPPLTIQNVSLAVAPCDDCSGGC